MGGKSACDIFRGARKVARGLLKPFLRESTPGSGLQVALKINGTLAICKCDGGFNPPRSEFGCVWHITGVLFFQSDLQIFCEAGVEMFRVQFALKNIDVVKFHFDGLPGRSSERIELVRPPAYALCASARQPSLSAAGILACRAVARSAAESKGWWVGRDSNSRPMP